MTARPQRVVVPPADAAIYLVAGVRAGSESAIVDLLADFGA